MTSKPNAAHHALAALQNPDVLCRLAPSLDPTNSPPIHITQNLDALCLGALQSQDFTRPGEKSKAEGRLIEMHGSLFRTRCTGCSAVRHSTGPLCSALAALTPEQEMASDIQIPLERLPKCGGDAWTNSNRYGQCGSLLRPDIVMFGEIPNDLGEIARSLNWCDLLLVVGTSLTVHPAAGFLKVVKDRGGKVVIFNLNLTAAEREVADFVFQGKCEEILSEILGL